MKRKRCVVIAVSEGIRDQNGHFLDDDSKYAKKDAFGHVLHSGTGKLLESLVFKEFGCKVRSIESVSYTHLFHSLVDLMVN